jgi:hypothetical protein
VMCPSGRRPSILFLSFHLSFITKFPIKKFFWDTFIFHSYNVARPTQSYLVQNNHKNSHSYHISKYLFLELHSFNLIFQSVGGASFFQELKQPERETDPSPLSLLTETAWSSTFTSHHEF